MIEQLFVTRFREDINTCADPWWPLHLLGLKPWLNKYQVGPCEWFLLLGLSASYSLQYSLCRPTLHKYKHYCKTFLFCDVQNKCYRKPSLWSYRWRRRQKIFKIVRTIRPLAKLKAESISKVLISSCIKQLSHENVKWRLMPTVK